MTAWWWIILCIGICAGQTPVLTPASGTSAKYKENKSLTCNYSTFVATDDFQLLQNSSIIYSNIGPAAGKESKYDINIQNGMVKLIIKNVDLSDIGDYVCNMDLTNSLSVKISVWSKPVVLIDHNDGIAVVTARGIYPHESNIINFEAEINNVKVTFPDGVVTRNAMDSNLFDIVWTAKKELDSVNPVVYVSFNIYGNFWNETQALNYVLSTTTIATTTTILTTQTTSGKKDLAVPVGVGVGVGVPLVVIVIVIVVCCFHHRKKEEKLNTKKDHELREK